MRFATVVWVGLVQNVVDHLGAIDYYEVSVGKLHVARILPRCTSVPTQREEPPAHSLQGPCLPTESNLPWL